MAEELTLVAVVVELFAIVVGAVWVVSRIKGTTLVLGEKISNLTKAIDHLGGVVEIIDRRVDEHGERIVRLEERTPKPSRGK